MTRFLVLSKIRFTIISHCYHRLVIFTQMTLIRTFQVKTTVTPLRTADLHELIPMISWVSRHAKGVTDQTPLSSIVVPPRVPVTNMVNSVLRTAEKEYIVGTENEVIRSLDQIWVKGCYFRWQIISCVHHHIFVLCFQICECLIKLFIHNISIDLKTLRQRSNEKT